MNKSQQKEAIRILRDIVALNDDTSGWIDSTDEKMQFSDLAEQAKYFLDSISDIEYFLCSIDEMSSLKQNDTAMVCLPYEYVI